MTDRRLRTVSKEGKTRFLWRQKQATERNQKIARRGEEDQEV